MTSSLSLWAAIAIQAVFASLSLEARSWVALIGQMASLGLLIYVAWHVHRHRLPTRRKDKHTTTGGSK